MSKKGKANFLEKFSAKWYFGYYIRYIRLVVSLEILIALAIYLIDTLSRQKLFYQVYAAIAAMSIVLAIIMLVISLNDIIFTRKIIKNGKCYTGKIIYRKKEKCEIEYLKRNKTEKITLPIFYCKGTNCKVYVYRDCNKTVNYYAVSCKF